MNVFSCSKNVNRQSIFSHYLFADSCDCTLRPNNVSMKVFFVCLFVFFFFFFFFFAQLGELVAWKNNMCFWNDAMTFARDTWNNKQFVKTVILNQMYISIVYMYMCMRRLFRMSYAKFMGLCDCLLCVWCIKKLSTCHTLTALALSYTKCQRTNLTTQNAFFWIASASVNVAILQLKGQICAGLLG